MNDVCFNDKMCLHSMINFRSEEGMQQLQYNKKNKKFIRKFLDKVRISRKNK